MISSSDASKTINPEEGDGKNKRGDGRGNKRAGPNPVPPHTQTEPDRGRHKSNQEINGGLTS